MGLVLLPQPVPKSAVTRKLMINQMLPPNISRLIEDLKPRNRAKELMHEIRIQLQALKHDLKPGQAVGVICRIRGEAVDLVGLSAISWNTLQIRHVGENQNLQITFAPVEQVSITLEITPMSGQQEQGRRQIGFKPDSDSLTLD